MQFSRRSIYDRSSVLYPSVSCFRADITLSWVVDWRVFFDLSSTTPHFLTNRSALIPWCRFIYIGWESTSCSLDPALDYQSIHHQVLSHSNGKKFHCSIKLMYPRVISTLDRWRRSWDPDINNIDVSMKVWTFPILLLHWRNLKQIIWWIPIKFIL